LAAMELMLDLDEVGLVAHHDVDRLQAWLI
jgi:hypothetical protein